MANGRVLSQSPIRLANPNYATSIIVLRNVGSTTAWYGDGDVVPGQGFPLDPGEQVSVPGRELFVVAQTLISDPRAVDLLDLDWGGRIVWDVQGA